MRLLIADDSDILCSRLMDALSDIKGVSIVGRVKSVAELTKHVHNLRPDVIILDIQLTDGISASAIEKIKKGENSPIIVMFTNFPYLHYRKFCFDAGADFFFYKALEFETLMATISNLARSLTQSENSDS